MQKLEMRKVDWEVANVDCRFSWVMGLILDARLFFQHVLLIIIFNLLNNT